ncbi:MAG: hypothetical protein ACYDGR_01735, partial [Candidatus Dormibacteria bacterium]
MLQSRAEVIAAIARIRWAAILLSLVMLRVTSPAPVAPAVLFGLTLVMVAYNVLLVFSGRMHARTVWFLAVASLAADFVVCAAWIGLTANDPAASNYVVFMFVGAEAAMLLLWRGMIAFSAAFLLTQALVFVERAEVFHYANSLPSVVFRVAVVVVMAAVGASLTAGSERRRAAAEVAAGVAIDESRRLEIVHRVALAVGSSLRRAEILEATVGALRQLLPGSFTAILLDDGNGVLR